MPAPSSKQKAKRNANGKKPEPSPLVANIRSPAPDLGPRATRMIARILTAAHDVFLAKGYGGTTMDEIARTADISRASVYTYFPTKRDVLLALGADSSTIAESIAARLREAHPVPDAAALGDLVDAYFEHLDEHGAFATAWIQAAHEDEELRTAGMRRHLRICRQIGLVLGSRGKGDDASMRGLAAYCLIERGWSFTRLYGDDIDLKAFKAEMVRMLGAVAGTTP